LTVEVVLRREDYECLASLATDQYRTVELQAGFMLRRLLEATNTDHVAGILALAKNKHSNGEAAL
jgi:hypothetical protein